MAKIVDPYDPTWVHTALLGHAMRVAEGVDPDRERELLFEELWPWAVQAAERAVRRAPPRADRSELRSQLLTAVWEATNRIDWDRPFAWPSLLKRRLHGARIDAARADDAMSRRDRQGYRKLQAALAAEEQQLGRRANPEERARLATRFFPHHPELVPTLDALATSPAGDALMSLAAERADDRWAPEAALLDQARREAVHHWLTTTVPPAIAEQLVDWASRDRAGATLPARLARRVLPYVDDLTRAVQEADAAAVVAIDEAETAPVPPAPAKELARA